MQYLCFTKLLQEGGPLPGPETGLLSNTRKLIVQGDTCADKARDLIGKGHPGELLCSLGCYGDGISFRVVFGQSLYFRVFPGGARIAQPRWMLVRGILGSARTRGVSFGPFPNSSGWWWLISSVFLKQDLLS